jgi:putative membrane protein
LFAALVSPMHPAGEVLFSAHMLQHELLMLIAAPLLVLGRPLIPFLWGLPPGWRRRAGLLSKPRWVQATWNAFTSPFIAWLIHGVALWAWHVPRIFEATLDSDLVHSLQHFSFLASALLFWWALLRRRNAGMEYGAAVLYVFTTAIHSSILGALLTFSSVVWYPAYSATTSAWGLTPLEDQQLGGLIMWVPGGIVFVAAGLALLRAWIDESERRVLAGENAALLAGAKGEL